jgi:taurine transport system permease protein
MKEIKDDVKAFRKAADDSEEVASTLAKDVLKIARRIEYASIFPPNTLMECKILYLHLMRCKKMSKDL